MQIFVAYDADGAGRLVGMARLRDDEVEIRRVSQALDRGNDIWKSWCFQKLGNFVEAGGDEGVFSVPAEALGEIPTMRQRYQDEVGATVSVGLGHSISEASKALLAAKLRGKDRVTVYNSTVELEVAAAKQQSTQQKEGDELFTSGLAKMALIHNDPRTPKTVWRVQNEAGEGPYGMGGGDEETAGIAQTGYDRDPDSQPSPDTDFTGRDWNSMKPRAKRIEDVGEGPPVAYGFENEGDAHDWFGSDNLDKLAARGYRLAQVPATKVWRSKSGRQVAFVPHASIVRKAESLAKAGSAGADSHVGGFEGAVSETPDHSEGQVARAEGPQSLSPVDRAHAMAQTAARADRASAVRDSGKLQQVKGQVSQALAGIQKQLPVLAEIKQAAPDAYDAIVSLTQAVVALGREVVGAQQDLQKAELAAKVWRAPGWGPGTGVTIPGAAHPNRVAYDAAYHNAVAARYANGDRNGVKPMKVAVADVEPNTPVMDQDRFKLYRKMIRAGDRVPPIVVIPKPGGGYRSPDGSHRLHAAVAEGASHLDALVVGQKFRKDEDWDAIAVPGFEIAWVPEFEELEKALPRKAAKQEPDPSETPPAGTELDKGLGEGAPVGTVLDGKVRVKHWDGQVGWKGARAGRILGKDPASHAVSAREPGAR